MKNCLFSFWIIIKKSWVIYKKIKLDLKYSNYSNHIIFYFFDLLADILKVHESNSKSWSKITSFKNKGNSFWIFIWIFSLVLLLVTPRKKIKINSLYSPQILQSVIFFFFFVSSICVGRPVYRPKKKREKEMQVTCHIQPRQVNYEILHSARYEGNKFLTKVKQIHELNIIFFFSGFSNIFLCFFF